MGKSIKVGATRELVPAGNYFGHVCGVYHIGTQDGGQFGPKEQVIIQWELHKRKGPATNAEGDVLTLSKFYTLTLAPKGNLRPDVEALIGSPLAENEEFDIEDLLGRDCRLHIAHEPNQKGQMRDVVKSVVPLDEDDPKIDAQLDERYYECDPSKPLPDWMPDWLKQIVSRSLEFTGGGGKVQAAAAVSHTHKPDDDEIPF